MYGAGDFDIEDRVTDSGRGEVVNAGAFGAYGDENEFGDEADFGNVGIESLGYTGGESESYNVMTIGDFGDDDLEDDDSFGSFKKLKKSVKNKFKKKTKASAQRAFVKAAPQSTKTLMTIPKAVVKATPTQQKEYVGFIAKKQQDYLSSSVRNFGLKNKKKIAAIQQKALVAGKQVPTTISLIPGKMRAKMIASATKKASAVAANKFVQPKSGIPTISPSSDQTEVVARAGRELTASDMDANVTTSSPVPMKVRSQYAHPMLYVMSPMGEGQMGFDLKSFLSDAKAKAAAALKQATADAKAKLLQRAGEAAGSISSKLINDPKVQTVLRQEADKAATNKIAEALRDPENRKKIALGGVAVLGLIGYLYYKSKKK